MRSGFGAQESLGVAGVTGSDAAALRTQNEGNEGAAIAGGGTSSLMDVGCFPSFWSGQDFSNWLNGDYTGELALC